MMEEHVQDGRTSQDPCATRSRQALMKSTLISYDADAIPGGITTTSWLDPSNGIYPPRVPFSRVALIEDVKSRKSGPTSVSGLELFPAAFTQRMYSAGRLVPPRMLAPELSRSSRRAGRTNVVRALSTEEGDCGSKAADD